MHTTTKFEVNQIRSLPGIVSKPQKCEGQNEEMDGQTRSFLCLPLTLFAEDDNMNNHCYKDHKENSPCSDIILVNMYIL